MVATIFLFVYVLFIRRTYDNTPCSGTTSANVTQYTTVTVDTCLLQNTGMDDGSVVAFKTTCSPQGALTYSYSSRDTTCSMDNSAQITMDDFQCKDFYDYDDGDAVTRSVITRGRKNRRSLLENSRSIINPYLFKPFLLKEKSRLVSRRIDQLHAIERARIFPSASSISSIVTTEYFHSTKINIETPSKILSNEDVGWIHTYSFVDFASCSTILPQLPRLEVVWNEKIALLETFIANKCMVISSVSSQSHGSSMLMEIFNGKTFENLLVTLEISENCLIDGGVAITLFDDDQCIQKSDKEGFEYTSYRKEVCYFDKTRKQHFLITTQNATLMPSSPSDKFHSRVVDM